MVTNIYYSNEYIDDVFIYLYITKEETNGN
nr:MAG TPA: hypothetical protein [Caudoviricetes sp.]